MSPFVVSLTILTIILAINADVSHLNKQYGYHYTNLGLTSNLKLHSPDSNPAPTQYHATYGDDDASVKLPNSYVPPPSGSPFGSVAPLPRTYIPQAQIRASASPSQRLSAPLQSPLLTGQKFGSRPIRPQSTYQFSQGRAIPTATYQNQYQRQPQVQQQYQYRQQPLRQQQQYQLQASAINNGFAQPAQFPGQLQQSQEPIITKHFYVHAAPDDPEDNENAAPRIVQIGRSRKNYKIIFIKAPTYSEKQQIIPVLPPTEEKTVVYVLSKKPTLNQNIQIAESAPTQPSKPDVFFIKYRTKEEAEQAQQQIQAAYDQANLSGNSIGEIAAQYVPVSTNIDPSSFGGQTEAQQQSNRGQYTSTTYKKRNIA